MPVSSTSRKAGPFIGNGVTTSFPFTFKVFAAGDVAVYYTGADGAQAKLTTGYTVALNADQDTSPGGSVTYPSGGASPMVATERLDLIGEQPYLQGVDIRNASTFQPSVIQRALDYLAILCQQLLEKVDRSISVPPGESVGPLPGAAARAGGGLGFDTDGNLLILPNVGNLATELAVAAQHAQDANASAELSQEWATKTDGPVSGGEFSAKYRAQEAATSLADAETAKNDAESAAGAASIAQAGAEAAQVAAEAARDSVNTTGKVFSDTTAGIAGTTSGQSFAVLDASLNFWIVYKNNAGVAAEVARSYTKAYVDALVQLVSSTYPYLIPFVAKDSGGNDRVLGGFDLSGKFNLGAVKDIGGQVATLAGQVVNDGGKSGWMLPFLAKDSASKDRALGGFDQLGQFWIGKKLAVKQGDYSFSYIGPTNTVTCWGDSLTEGSGGTPYPTQLAALLGRSVNNMGYGGQTAEKIVSRQGGYCALLTVSGNQIPGSGAVAVTMGTAILSYPSATSKSITGSIRTLAGPIAGTLTKDSSGNYTFTRAVAGTAATVLPNTPFEADTLGYDFGINILWAGTNDVGTSSISTVSDFVDRFVESIKTTEKRFLILSPLADSSFTSGTAGYTNMRAEIEAIKLRYPRNFLDVQERLVNSYDPGAPQDVTDFGNKVTPSSLRADTVHLNSTGYGLVAQWVYQFLSSKGWA